MPTKTKQDNSPSPLTIDPMTATMLIKAGVGGTANVISNYRQAKAAGEDYSFKEGAGDALTGMAGSFGMGGLFGSQNVKNPNPQTNFASDPTQTQPAVTSPEVMPQMTQLENIDPAQSQLSSLFGGQDPLNQTQSPNKMEKQSRTKMPAAYTMSYSPVNMSAYQAKEADKMMNISGALTLSAAQQEIAEKSGDPNEIEGSDFAVLRNEKKAPTEMNYQKAAPMMSGQSIYNMNHKK